MLCSLRSPSEQRIIIFFCFSPHNVELERPRMYTIVGRSVGVSEVVDGELKELTQFSLEIGKFQTPNHTPRSPYSKERLYGYPR